MQKQSESTSQEQEGDQKRKELCLEMLLKGISCKVEFVLVTGVWNCLPFPWGRD